MKALVVKAHAIPSLPLLMAVLAALAATGAIGVARTAAVCGRLVGDDPVPPDAQIVVVGTVLQTAGHEQNALIHVDDVWRGGPQPEWLPLIGTTDPNVLWEDSTRFSAGTRYLVVADRDGGVIRPRGCGYTTPYTAALAELRPADASRPFAAPRPDVWPPGIPWWVLLGGAAAALLAVLALAIGFGRRRALRAAARSS